MLHPCEIRWSWCKSVIRCVIIVQTVSAVDLGFVSAAQLQFKRHKQQLQLRTIGFYSWRTLVALISDPDALIKDGDSGIHSQTLSTPLQSISSRLVKKFEISAWFWPENRIVNLSVQGFVWKPKMFDLHFRRLIKIKFKLNTLFWLLLFLLINCIKS